jgi:hypothetical protein
MLVRRLVSSVARTVRPVPVAVATPSMLSSMTVRTTSHSTWPSYNHGLSAVTTATARSMTTHVTPPIPTPTSTSTSTNSSSSNGSSDDTTHFGYQTVAKGEKEHLVGEVFHRVASTYDLMNDVMTVGIHRLWKDQFIDMLHPLPGMKLLDVAGGTGTINSNLSSISLSHQRHISMGG